MRPNIWNVESDEQTVQRLLEISANNDVQGLIHCIQHKPGCIDGVGLWQSTHVTPLMVAAAYGSFEVVQILSWYKPDVNRSCGHEMVTALHYAASSGSAKADAVVRLLLKAGADPKIADARGRLPRDMIVSSQQAPWMMNCLQNILNPERDELVMKTHKVHPCGEYGASHNSEVCTYYHPIIGDRRRNPWQYGYSSEACADYQGTDCPRGDMCKFAHGIFERRFHPDLYKTKVCPLAQCDWETCTFAHSERGRRRPPPWPVVPPLMASTPYPDTYVQQQQQRLFNQPRSQTGLMSPTVDPSMLHISQRSGQTPMVGRCEVQPQQRRSYAEVVASSQRKTSSHEGESSNS